jgi:uncharacterized membrane protein YraQ (UPF0718 family)
MGHWFWFSASDFAYSFLSVVLEGVPFILVGVLLSGLVDVFLPPRVLARVLPRNPAAGIYGHLPVLGPAIRFVNGLITKPE